jgi:hypothetical protein
MSARLPISASDDPDSSTGGEVMRVITARRLIDGTSTQPVDYPAILIDDRGRVVYAGPRAGMMLTSTAVQWIDLGPRTILPLAVAAPYRPAVELVPDGQGRGRATGPASTRSATLARPEPAARIAAGEPANLIAVTGEEADGPSCPERIDWIMRSGEIDFAASALLARPCSFSCW